MRSEGKGTTAVILTACCAVATTVLFRGFSGVLIALVPLSVAAGLSVGTVLFPLQAVFIILGLISPEAAPWAVLLGGTLSSVAGEGIRVRTAGFLSVAAVLWFLPLAGVIPLAAASAAGAFLHRRRCLPYVILAGGYMVSVLLTGPPKDHSQVPAIAPSSIENGQLTYHVPSLTAAGTEVQLCVPPEGRWAIWIAVDGGGVRDTMPMMSLSLGESMLFLPRGKDTLCLTGLPGDTLSVALLRGHRPFSHPVVHINAGGELI